jgi:branched-chain amino acid transport system permease protein
MPYLGLATVLVFTVTRVIFIPQGEFVAYGALTLAMLQTGKMPGTDMATDDHGRRWPA